MKAHRSLAAVLVGAVTVASAALTAGRAAAWDVPTQVGLAEQAGLAANLDGTLRRLGWRGGLFETLVVPPEDAPAMMQALAEHSPTDGFVPDIRGQQYALGWFLAGAAIADANPSWAANHFLDPDSGAGWRSGGLGLGARLGARVAGGGGMPAHGVPAIDWITSADNPLGLDGFLDQYGKAMTAATPGERSRAMAGALVAAGAILHVLGDMGSPAHVRGAAGDQLEVIDVATGERGARLDRIATIAYGRLGVPAASSVVQAADLRSFFVGPGSGAGGVGAGSDGGAPGLATWTAGHFFTPSTLPRPVAAGRIPAPQLAAALAEALRRPAPAVPARRLGLVSAIQPEGSTLHDDAKVCLARYRVERGLLSWWIDDDCLLEQAQEILPVTAGYEAGLLHWLFRGELELDQGDDGAIAIHARGSALGAGKLTILAEDPRGVRAVVNTVGVTQATDGASVGSAIVPAGSRRVVAVYRGMDAAGQPLLAVGVLDRLRTGP